MAVTEEATEQAQAKIAESEARRHLELVLASSAFSKTKRHARFLRFVVDKTFGGHADEIKERTLGIEIFDRVPNYDLSDDPIVRVTAGDIRKRLQQYYREEGEKDSLRLELPTGSYVPIFRSRPIEVPAAVPPAAPPKEVSHELPSGLRKYFGLIVAVALFLLALLLIALFSGVDWRATRAERDLRKFWAPLEMSPGGVVGIVVGDVTQLDYNGVQFPDRFKSQLFGSRAITGPGNTYALAQIADRLGEDNQQVRTYMADSVNLTDLRSQPSILIGAYDNLWTMRMLDGERFTMFVNNQKRLVGIRDNAHPDSLQWTKDEGAEAAPTNEDFAIVTRKHSPLTGQMFVCASGMGAYGTVAAAEFVSHPEYFAQFARIAPANWAQKDLQIVIAVNVVGGRTSPPRVLSYSLE
jgi:hypothetical protein